MSKGKKKKTARPGGKTVQGVEPISKRKRMKPMARNLIVSSVVTLALAEVLLRVDLIGKQVNTAMYIVALIAAVAAVFVEFSGLGRDKMDMD